jgi:hypothetical protein
VVLLLAAACGGDESTPPGINPPGVPPADLVFSTEWASGDPMDGFDERVGNGQLSEVVSSSGLDFPTAQVLAVNGQRRTSDGSIIAEHFVAALADSIPHRPGQQQPSHRGIRPRGRGAELGAVLPHRRAGLEPAVPGHAGRRILRAE